MSNYFQVDKNIINCTLSATSPSTFWNKFNVTSPSLLLPNSKMALTNHFLHDLIYDDTIIDSSIIKKSYSTIMPNNLAPKLIQFKSFMNNLNFQNYEIIQSVFSFDMTGYEVKVLFKSEISINSESNLINYLVEDNETSPVFDIIAKRKLGSSGYHRNLITSISINKPLCSLLIVDHMSESIYSDPFELQEIARFGGIQSSVLGFVDIEKPFSHSNQAIMSSKIYPLYSKNEIIVSIPIHVRYHTPAADTRFEFSILPPSIYHRCESDKIWSRLTVSSEIIHDSVPVGILSHDSLVAIGTFTITIGATALLLYKIVYKQISSKNKSN